MPRKTNPNAPADWLLISASDVAGLKHLAEAEISHAMCRSKLAEVLEKILKAELLRLGWPLLKTHDVQHLASELDARGSDLSRIYRPLAQELAEVYFTDRYPGFDLEDPDWPDFRAKLAEVEKLLAAVQARLPQPKS